MNTKYHFSKKDYIVVLSGAGISAESGIKTFRDHDGLWENYPIEEVATPEAFICNPKRVWRFYKQRFYQLSEVSPNLGHLALVELENYMGDNFCLITQNVDGLHRRAGSKKLLEMHGQLEKAFCINCHSTYLLKEINLNYEIPKCNKCNASLRPDIVWFGEEPYFLTEIDQALRNATHFITIGTSGTVYPAAQFLMISHSLGVNTIGINLAEPDNRFFINEFHQGKSGEVLPKLVKEWTR